MKTQISLIVKKDTFFSRYIFCAWKIFFKKATVSMVLDEVLSEALKPSKEPYIFDVQPGKHEITFIDMNARKKLFAHKAATGIAGAGMSWGAGSSIPMATLIGGEVADAVYDGIVRKGVLRIEMKEGDLLKISAQPNMFGNVKIEVLN